LREKFAQPTDVKGVFGSAVHPSGFRLVFRAGDVEGRGVPPGSFSESCVLELSAMAQDELVDRFTEAREKFVTLNEICAKLSPFSPGSPARIADGCVNRKRPQPI
jgi:hypothetical protein